MDTPVIRHPCHSRILLHDAMLELQGECPGIREKLRFWRREIGFSRETHRKAVSGHYEELWTVQEKKPGQWSLFTMPGFCHLILDYCRSHGYSSEVVDCRTPMPEIDVDAAFEGLRDYQMDAVEAAMRSGGGILQLPTGSGKTRIATAILKAFPRDEMIKRGTPTYVFACPDKDINRKNWLELTKLLPDRDVGLVMSGSRKFSDDIVCCTIDSLENLDPKMVGVFICDEVHTAASPSRGEKIQLFTKARKWGVSATPTGRFDGADLLAEGLFGPIVFNMTYKDMVERGALVPIHVFWMECPDPKGGLRHYSELVKPDAKIRLGSTRNDDFAQLVADIVLSMPDDLQTLVMVQYLEHMDNINKRCDGKVEICHGETNADNLLRYPSIRAISPRERKAIYDDVANGTIRKAMSSMIWKQGVDIRDLSVVVNAAGGGSDIVAKQIPGRASRTNDATGKDMAFVIDFWHSWDTDQPEYRDGKGKPGPLLSADRKRKKAYEQLGFKQTWLQNIKELPMLDPQKAEESQSAAYSPKNTL